MNQNNNEYECSDCGAEVSKDDKTCPKCGATFERPDENLELKKDATDNSKISVCVLSAKDGRPYSRGEHTGQVFFKLFQKWGWLVFVYPCFQLFQIVNREGFTIEKIPETIEGPAIVLALVGIGFSVITFLIALVIAPSTYKDAAKIWKIFECPSCHKEMLLNMKVLKEKEESLKKAQTLCANCNALLIIELDEIP